MKKIDNTTKKIDALTNTVKVLTETIKKSIISPKFVEEEIVIDVKYVENDNEIEHMMVIDSGAPVSLVSSDWLKQYLKEAKVDNKEVKKAAAIRDSD